MSQDCEGFGARSFLMGRRRTPLVLLAAVTFLLGMAVGFSACGGEEEGEEEQPRIEEALLLLARPDLSDLSDAERDLIGLAMRAALARAGAVRLTSAIDQQDIVFGPDGSVRISRLSETIGVYEGPPARFCDGREDPELTMLKQYVLESGQWRVSASAIPPEQIPLGLLFSKMGLAQDAGLSEDQGRRLRGLSLPFPQPGDPSATVTVWVDLEDALIRKLVATVPGSPGASLPFTFDYEIPIQIEVPSIPAAPDCVPVESGD